MLTHSRSILPLLALVLALTPMALAAQQEIAWTDSRPLALRSDLEHSLAELERLLGSGQHGEDARAQMQRNADRIRLRLSRGDFSSGDRIALRVTGEPELTDTFTITSGPVLDLPSVGEISLQGVLRSELHATLEPAIQRVIRSAEVRAQPLVRLSITGAVGSPGFYTVSADAPIPDAIMAAGGLSPTAVSDRMIITRSGSLVWGGTALEQVVASGWTVDQLGLQSGDRLDVPEREPGGTMRIMQIVAMSVTVVATLITILSR